MTTESEISGCCNDHRKLLDEDFSFDKEISEELVISLRVIEE